MAGGFCVRWTTWRVLLHPFKARKQIEEANGMQDDLSKRLEEALEMLEKQRKECARITMDNVEMSRRLSECEFELSRTRSELATTKRKLAEAEDQLAEHKSVDEKIAEFNKELTKAEAMKHSYEKRIAELESRGWALVRASNTGPNITMRFEASTLELLEEISEEFKNLLESLVSNLDNE